MSKEIDNIASIIDRVRNSVWEDGYYLDYRRHSKTIARAIHESGYRREADVVGEIMNRVAELTRVPNSVEDHDELYQIGYYDAMNSVLKGLRKIAGSYFSCVKYQERTNTIREVKELYNRVTKDPHIKQYRGHTASKSYGYDAETGKIIVKDGEFWFDNPSFHGG